MTSGRYTAYHIYQGLSFPEAQKAGTRPYKLPEYQCRHSQRGYLFQFENMVERTHFDAANTSCCNEPVRNFENKPQYVESFKPMNPKDCKSSVQATGCTVLEVSVESASAICAQQGAKVRRIKILCPTMCTDFASLQGGGSFKGRYGTFRSLGLEAGDILIMDYVPDPDLIHGWYGNCSGSRTLTEEFCGGYTLRFSLNAGLNYPGGCGCDCCGENGSFPPPLMTLSHPIATNDWSNTIDLHGSAYGEGCSGGQIKGSFSGINGGGSLPWSGSTKYSGSQSSRSVSRAVNGEIGSASKSMCCGAFIEWSGTDGCGGGDRNEQAIAGRITSSQISPASGTTLYESSGYVFSGSEACSYAADAGMTFSRSCLTNSGGTLNRYNGHMTLSLGGPLTFSGTHHCSGCCGNGALLIGFTNGCGGSYSASYQVARSLGPGAYSDVVGRVYKCESFFRSIPPTGYYYRVARADLYCAGQHGGFSNPFGDYYYTLGECVSGISGAGAANLSGQGGCGNMSGGPSCCWYSDNGMEGTAFESTIAVVSGSKCCNIPMSNGDWIFSGAGNPCCPAE
ncbi:MAG: hypothetical protein HY913_18935 [Desulfomonile tiedjei]|nr:hypothetical protein [Desulfomonile tiedjei]